MTTTLRSRDDLITAFPDLGRTGAEAEARAALALAGSRYQFLDDAFDDPDTIAVLKPWSINNTPMVGLSAATFDKGRVVARREAIDERYRFLVSYGQMSGDIAAGAARWVDERLEAIEAMERAGQAFSEIDRISRGATMRSDAFDAEFKMGERVRWRGLTACTLDPEFTPIHYAWKQRAELVKTEPPGDVTSYILDIRLEAHPLPLLVWTGAVVGQYDVSTYRWQAEVVTPPGFEFEVTSVNDLNPGSPDRLVVVEAEYVPPVTGSPASSP